MRDDTSMRLAAPTSDDTPAREAAPADDGPTCGKGVAEHAALPAGLAALLGSVADNLEAHLPSLDPADERAARERDAYAELIVMHRDVADRLRSLAARMSGCRDLPMGRHDERALAAPEVVDAFRRFVALQEEVASLLGGWAERDRRMLEEADPAG